MPKLTIKRIINAKFIKNPVDTRGNTTAFTFKWLSPYTNTALTARMTKTTKKVNIVGGSTRSEGAEVSMIVYNL